MRKHGKAHASALAAPAVTWGWWEWMALMAYSAAGAWMAWGWLIKVAAYAFAAVWLVAEAHGATFGERWWEAVPAPRPSMAACSWVEHCRVA